MKTKINSNNQRGAALITSIFAVLLVTIIAFALIATGMVSLDISKNSREQTEAYYISESGLTHGSRLVRASNPYNFNSILQAGDGIANTGDELSTQPTALTPIPVAGIAFGTGSYTVSVGDDPSDADGNPNTDSNGRIVITSVGFGQNGATVTTEAIVSVMGIGGMLINSNAEISGNPTVRGLMGRAHANGTMTLNGFPCADQGFSASGNFVNPTRARTGAGCGTQGIAKANQDRIEPPTWNIRNDFYNRADYILGATGASAGKVFSSNGTLIANTNLTLNTWIVLPGSIWTWNPATGTWRNGGNSMPNGVYYSDGNIELGSSIGSLITPVRATFVAEGYINVSGSSIFRPRLENYQFMAGTDLIIAGNAGGGVNYEGINYAGHQINFSGTPGINGIVIAANIADTNSPVCSCNPAQMSGGTMHISGNPTITYNGGLLSSMSRLISWREVRY